jgi:hypothetical protein
VYVSPACTPGDLGERLERQGYVRQEGQEAWMIATDLSHRELPTPSSRFTVREITEQEAIVAARIFVASFGMPGELAPLLAQVMAPSVGMQGVHHYLVLVKDQRGRDLRGNEQPITGQRGRGQPIGTCSLLCWGTYGVLGSAGILPRRRGRGAGTALVVRAVTDARADRVDTLVLQTSAGTPLERLLRIVGFVRAFTRVGYTLP